MTRGMVALVVMLAASPSLAQDKPEAQKKASEITLDDVYDNPTMYAGQTVTVKGEVEQVIGPRAFTVDNGRWIDFKGDTVVVLPQPLAALVRAGDEISITGVVTPLTETTIEQEQGWFSKDETIKAEIQTRSGIVAQSIVRDSDRRELALRIDMGGPASGEAAVNDVGVLANATDLSMVGRHVDLQSAKVESVAKGGGFWVASGKDKLFVLPDRSSDLKVSPGQEITVQGYVLELPDALQEQLGDEASGEEVYVFAREIQRSS